MRQPTIRLYRPGDHEAVRRICCDTACYGEPIERIFSDREFMADALMNYYTDHESDSLFVADLDGRVIGYCAGCLDTRRFLKVTMKRVVPRLLWLFMAHGHIVRVKSWRLMFAMMVAGRKQTADRPKVIEMYPAHCHVNIQAGLQRKGVGSRLLHAWFELMKQRGVNGIHVSTATEQGKKFFGKAGLEVVARYPTPKLPIDAPRELWVMGRLL